MNLFRKWISYTTFLTILLAVFASTTHAQEVSDFVNWESPHVHPLDLTPDNVLLVAVNTPDAKLEVFRVEGDTPVSIATIPVGLDPVSVRARTNNEVWVINHVSDSISIVDLNAGVVTHTLKTDDEPTDVVFAGNPQRAFVSASQANTVMVFDPANLNAEPQTLAIAGEDPRALAVSTDGNTVYAAIFESGNASTIVRGGRTAATFGGSGEYYGVDSPNGPYAGQNPPPNSGNNFSPALNPSLPVPPRVSMIVKKNSDDQWFDDNNGDWTDLVSGSLAEESGRMPGWDMPDNDVAIINANTLDVSYQQTLMNMVMGIAVNPLNNRVTVVGTDALNEVRYEPNLKSHFVTSRFADFPAAGGATRIADLNSHLDPDQTFINAQERLLSVGDPRSITWSPDGISGYVTAMGSNSVVEVARNGTRRGDSMPVQVGQGPTGSVFHAPSARLFVLNRFEASISVVNFAARIEDHRVSFSFDPTPAFINEGRRLLYDTQAFSGLGQVSCASCHVDARHDRLTWDLGNPAGEMTFFEEFEFHPMKGPMRTTSLIGTVGSPVLHFRGDRETIADFSTTYTNLQGTLNEPTAGEMEQLESFIASIHTPPNPFRNLDNSMPDLVLIPGPEGRIGNPHNPSNDCSRCHNPATNGRGGVRNGGGNSPGQQPTTVPSLRSMYEILGFSLGRNDGTAGFGFIADGVMDSLASRTLQDNNSMALMMTWNGDLPNDTHAAVGTQITLNGLQTTEDTQTLSQLIELASTRDIGLVAHGLRNNGRGQRGFTYLPDTNNFQSMVAGGFTTLANIQSQATAEFPITFTAVPAGSEFRLGVDRDSDGTFDLDEEVGPPVVQNLALNGTATQSSTRHSGVAARAIDGNTNGFWRNGSVTHTRNQNNAWWQVQLAQTSTINQIVIHNRQDDCCVSRLANYTVSVFDSDGNSVWSQTFASTPTPTQVINLAVNARTVRVSLNGTLSLAEVEVIGFVAQTDPDTGFVPDPTKLYHIDNPAHGLRLAARANSEILESAALSSTGDNTRWQFIQSPTPGLWHIQRAAGGSTPRIRTQLTTVPDMQAASFSGDWTRFSITPNPDRPGTYLLTVPLANTVNQRLRLLSNGVTDFAATTNTGNNPTFIFTEVN